MFFSKLRERVERCETKISYMDACQESRTRQDERVQVSINDLIESNIRLRQEIKMLKEYLEVESQTFPAVIKFVKKESK